MKKILLFSVLGICFFFSCKKKVNDPSQDVHVSVPVITLTGSQYYSIQVGAALPTITATAVDTYYKVSVPVVVDASTLDNTTPGLYQVNLTATNKYGFIGYSSVYIGVTSASASLDLSGWYERSGTPTKAAYISKLATGLFMTSNVGGVDTVASASAVLPAVFVVTSNTTIDFGQQSTADGLLTASNQILSLAPGDTSISYILTNPSSVFSATAVRTLVKQ